MTFLGEQMFALDRVPDALVIGDRPCRLVRVFKHDFFAATCLYRSEGDGARSIPLIAAERVGDGLIMRTERRGKQFHWHLLVDDTVSELHDEVRENLRDGLSLTVKRLGTPPCLREDGRVQRSLTPEQKAALEAAIEHGYYDVPRQQSVTEIAADIGVSSSTLQYRLNRAEAWLAHQFAADSVSVDVDAEFDLEDIEFVR